MNIIRQNPFRILGLTANATERELQRQLGKIKAYTRVGKDVKLDYDFEFIGDFTRNLNEIQEASNRIEQAHNKFLYSLFWFVKNTPFDEIAFNNLKENYIDKAIEIWNKTLKEEITIKNYSSYQNLSTLYLALSTNDDQIELQKLQAGIFLKGKLIHSENLKNLSKLVTGNDVASDAVDISKKFVDEVIKLFKPYLNKTNGISTSDLVSLFNTFPSSIQKYILSKFTEVPISAIENKIEKTTQKRKESSQNADEYAKELYKSSRKDITLLKQLMGTSNLQFQMLVDKFANEILQCSVDFFNEQQKNGIDDNFETNLNTAIELFKLAKSVAVNRQVKDRALENTNTLIEMKKDRVILQAIALLKSVKDTFEANEKQIRRQKKIDELNLRLWEKINWSAVEEDIANSINWEEVNRLLILTLPENNLKKIKESENSKLKNEFLGLANWLKNKSLKNTTISNIINKYKKIPPKLPFKIRSSIITNTGNKPLYNKYIRYIGLRLNVKVTKNTSLTFYLKYLKPDGSINRNSKNSPSCYTLSETQELDTNTSSINFSGWGNADKCTYDIGEHKIEVYIEDYLIYSKKFIVDLAPSEKFEIELKKAEEKLTKIKKTEFYTSEIQAAHFEMSEIQKFQLFRRSTNKKSQISAQQRKIDNLHQKVLSEKEKLIEQQHKIIYRLKSYIQNAEY